MKLFKTDKSKHITWGFLLALLLWILFSVVSMFTNKPSPPLAGQNFNDFSWLVGTWSGDFGGGNFTETWEMNADNKMVGSGSFSMENEVVFTEQLSLQAIGNHMAYISTPDDSKPVLFTLTETSGNSWTFENEEHDFPKKIIYTKKENGSLFVQVKGKAMGFIPASDDYLMTKK